MLKLPRNYGYRNLVIIIIIILSHFYPPKSHYFLFSISVEFHQETNKKKKRKNCISGSTTHSLEKQSNLSRGSSSTQIGEVIEKNSIWGKKRKEPKNQEISSFSMGYFIYFLFFSFGWKKLNLKSYPDTNVIALKFHQNIIFHVNTIKFQKKMEMEFSSFNKKNFSLSIVYDSH